MKFRSLRLLKVTHNKDLKVTQIINKNKFCYPKFRLTCVCGFSYEIEVQFSKVQRWSNYNSCMECLRDYTLNAHGYLEKL
jgi:hypothetical protein